MNNDGGIHFKDSSAKAPQRVPLEFVTQSVQGKRRSQEREGSAQHKQGMERT
jgi:hypothetical protein